MDCNQIGKGFGWGCLAQIGHVDVASATDERYSIASTPSTAGYPPLIGDSTEKTLTTVLPACFVAVVTCFAFIVGYRMIRRGTRYVWQPQRLQARTLDIPELWDVKLHDKHRLLEYQDFEMVLPLSLRFNFQTHQTHSSMRTLKRLSPENCFNASMPSRGCIFDITHVHQANNPEVQQEAEVVVLVSLPTSSVRRAPQAAIGTKRISFKVS